MQKSRKGATWFCRVHGKSTLTHTQLISVLSRSTQERTGKEPTQVAPCGSKGYLVPGTFLEMFSLNWSFGESRDQDNHGSITTVKELQAWGFPPRDERYQCHLQGRDRLTRGSQSKRALHCWGGQGRSRVTWQTL